MELAAGSLLQLAVDGETAILLGRIISITKLDSAPSEERGIIAFEIARELTTKHWHGPDTFEVIYARFANRIHRQMQAEGWNTIDIIANAWLVIGVDDLGEAAKAKRSPAVPAKGAAAVQDDNDPLVLGLQSALTIEATKDAGDQKALITKGLASDLAFLRAYSHYACGRLHRIPRPDAVELELAILNNEAARPDNRRTAAVVLELELWKMGDSQDVLNQRIVSGLVNALTTGDRDLRRMVLEAMDRVLFANVPSDAHTFRQQMIQGIAPRSACLTSLQECVSFGPAAQEAAKILGLFSTKK